MSGRNARSDCKTRTGVITLRAAEALRIYVAERVVATSAQTSAVSYQGSVTVDTLDGELVIVKRSGTAAFDTSRERTSFEPDRDETVESGSRRHAR